MIEFGKMQVEGFSSIQEAEFDWGIPGLNILQAPNGYGKTKFINALVWCLFGKTLSGSVETWDHLRSSSYQGTKVSTPFMLNDMKFIVTRYKGYTKMKNALIVERDGIDWDYDKFTTQHKLEQALGYNYELFKASIIFGQKLKRIISETGPNKKKVFDEAFEVTYIQKGKKIAEEIRNRLNTEHQEKSLAYEKILGTVNAKQAEIDSQQWLIDNFEEGKKKELQDIKEKVRAKRVAHGELLSVNADIDEQLRANRHELEMWEKDMFSNAEIIKMEKKLTRREGKRDREEEDAEKVNHGIQIIKSMIENVPTSCDNCGKPFTKEERVREKERLEKDLKEEQKTYQSHIDTIGKLRGQIKELNGDISSAVKLQESYDITTKNIDALEKKESELNESEKELKELIKKKHMIRDKKLTDRISKLQIELTDLQGTLKTSKRELRQINRDLITYQWVIKDPLSNSGIKAFIFNLMLDKINDRLEFYTKYTKFQVAFFMDMKSANKDLETYVFHGEQPVPYDDLSGGQQQSVDIATAFAIHDVVSSSKSCSLLAMDEVFESLDKDNIELITEIIQDKAADKCLYVVTHRPEFNPTNSNIINILFEDGVTSLA